MGHEGHLAGHAGVRAMAVGPGLQHGLYFAQSCRVERERKPEREHRLRRGAPAPEVSLRRLQDAGRDIAAGARGAAALEHAWIDPQLGVNRPVVALNRASLLLRALLAEQPRGLEHPHMMVEAGGLATEQSGDLHDRARLLGQDFHDAQPQRIGERPHLVEVTDGSRHRRGPAYKRRGFGVD